MLPKYWRRWLALACAAGFIMLRPPSAGAHGFVGDRFFPPTIATDDPFATDELSFPTVSVFKDPGMPETRQIDAGFEFDKEIFPHFALGIEGEHDFLKAGNQRAVDGWDDFALTAKYELWRNAGHEMIFSIGLEWDIGGTGTKHIAADSVSTFVPTLYFGKGFGDLPDSLWELRPFAVTGTLGLAFPSGGGEAATLQTGLALEYSFPYLEQNVRDIGIPRPFRNMIPVVEFVFQDPTARSGRGDVTGTINPGVLWESDYCQLGIEAIIPINGASGHHIGAVVNVQIYIDDIWPHVFGHPLFGND